MQRRQSEISSYCLSSSSGRTSSGVNFKNQERINSERNRIPEVNEEGQISVDFKFENKNLPHDQSHRSHHELLKKYEQVIMESMEEIERLNSLLSIRESQISALSGSFRTLNTNYNQLKDSISHLQSENTELKRNRTEREKMLLEVNSKNQASNFSRPSQLQTESKREQSYINDLEKDNEKLRQELHEEKRKNREKNKRISAMAEKIKAIEEFKAHQKHQLKESQFKNANPENNNISFRHSFEDEKLETEENKESTKFEIRSSKNQKIYNSHSLTSPDRADVLNSLGSHLELESKIGLTQKNPVKRSKNEKTPPKCYIQLSGQGHNLGNSLYL